MGASGVDGGSIVDNGLKAIEELEKAKAIAEEMDDKESVWVSTFNLAVTLTGLGQIEEAVDLFKQCLVVSNRKGYRKLCPKWTLEEEGFIDDSATFFSCFSRHLLQVRARSLFVRVPVLHSLSLFVRVCVFLMHNAVWQTPWTICRSS